MLVVTLNTKRPKHTVADKSQGQRKARPTHGSLPLNTSTQLLAESTDESSDVESTRSPKRHSHSA